MADLMSDPLVSTAWLADRLEDPSIRILDASWFMPGTPRDPNAEYALAHIPGAMRFDIDAVSDHASPLPHMMPEPTDFATAVRRLGVNPESTVVVYDSIGIFSAPRVWWALRAMGHEAVYVLDGGLPRWVEEGHPVETGWREAEHGEFKAHPVAELVRGLDEMVETVKTGSSTIIDARPAPRFRGAAPEPRPGVRAGHMPGALNVPYASLIVDGGLARLAALRTTFEDAGVDLAAPIVATCGSGISAAVIALALARLGRRDIAVYDGSWTEWGGRADTPVVVDPAP